MTEKTESSWKKSENNKFRKGTTHTKGAEKNDGKMGVHTFGAKIERKASSRQLKLLLPAIE